MKKKKDMMLLNEEKVVPKLGQNGERVESNIWHLDNGTSNHMTESDQSLGNWMKE